ncbi:hypothetical protein [Helicobacter pylori]|uniref:hypothetical protein n=1 Tax=Helicobacter pylori TaxID=210 RepID=UPI001F08B295|nr:hypothetical protein [Helicobacter pylori]
MKASNPNIEAVINLSPKDRADLSASGLSRVYEHMTEGQCGAVSACRDGYNRKCKFGQLIGKSELVSFGKDMNPSTKSFQSAYSKIHGKKFFFYKPTQIAENTLQSLKAKLDANRMKTSTTGGVIGTFRLCGYEKGVQVG